MLPSEVVSWFVIAWDLVIAADNPFRDVSARNFPLAPTVPRLPTQIMTVPLIGSIRTRKAKPLNAIILVALNSQIFGLEFTFENFHFSQELLGFQRIKH